MSKSPSVPLRQGCRFREACVNPVGERAGFGLLHLPCLRGVAVQREDCLTGRRFSSGKVLEVTNGSKEREGDDDEDHAGPCHPELFLFIEAALLVAIDQKQGKEKRAVHRAIQPIHLLPTDQGNAERQHHHDQEEPVFAFFYGLFFRHPRL